jgi:uncharacterized protein (TIGR00251 family)
MRASRAGILGDVGAILQVRVQPRASKNELVGWQAGALKIRLTAPPVEGAANAALVAFLAEVLGVRRGELRLLSGDTGRNKRLEVASLSPEELAARLEALGVKA